MGRALGSFVCFAALLIGVAAGHWWGWQSGREAGRKESAEGFSQAARNGYEEGYADAKEERPKTGPRMVYATISGPSISE